ncbi:MAG TPA: VOC family protein [bacterium]|nr:VOC family protein [bacterium]
MNTSQQPKPGDIAWIDLTVANAGDVREFYHEVVGWTPAPVSMGDYDDFNMLIPAEGKPAAGICHAKGVNAGLPPQWLIHIVVEDLEKSVTKCQALGGEIIADRRKADGTGCCVIRDPGGAVAALYQT